MTNDLRYAVRALAHTPGFTTVAAITLALGIGANTAIFSVVSGVLLRPLPYPRPSELVALHESLPARGDRPGDSTMPLAPPTTRDWMANTTLSSLAPYSGSTFILTGAGEPVRIPGANVAWTFFDTLGATPAAGRLIARADDRPNQPPVAVIGYDLWRSRYGADSSLVGRTVELSGERHTVVGVAQPGFAFPAEAQIWTPLALPEEEYADDQRLSFYLDTVGRLKPGVTREQAAADLNAITARFGGRFPEMYEGRGATVLSLRDALVGDVRPALLLLLGTVGVVLLIACANVANLTLGRALARENEMTVRAALGATTPRILRQWLAESLVIAVLGGITGVLLALWARDAIVALSPADIPRIAEVGLDLRVLAFTAAITLATAIVSGLAPAMAVFGRVSGDWLKSGRKATASVGRRRARNAVVIAELALSLALLVGAGLLARTFWKLTSEAPGFDADQVMTMEVVLPQQKYADPSQRAAFFDAVLHQLRANPLVESAGGTTNLPLSNTNMSFGFYREGMVPDRDQPLIANVRAVTAGYFPTMRIPVVRGRAIGSTDRVESAPVVVINQATQRKFWPDADPIGQRLALTRGRTTVWREIVGIVGDVRHASLGTAPKPEIYMPYAHDPFMFLRIAVRSNASTELLAGTMRAAVWAVDRNQPVSRVRPMADVVAASVAQTRFGTVLISAFALLALVLASVGLYGVIAYSVTLRLHELGIRVALGAERRHVVGLVLRQALGLAGTGLALGLILALGLARGLTAQLYGVSSTDPVTLAGVTTILVAVTLLASYLPARRALSIDPAIALRRE
ncbi:MAG TPA: ABC transporter permease [Vicinamibacterales bacterium]|nr:ABC transporter permease [Vicinamibacterales bacterium]